MEKVKFRDSTKSEGNSSEFIRGSFVERFQNLAHCPPHLEACSPSAIKDARLPNRHAMLFVCLQGT